MYVGLQIILNWIPPSLALWKCFKMIHFLYISLELTFDLFPFLSQGLAYQLIDDVLDFTGTSASLGKGSLSDIRHVIHFSLMCYLIEGI
jgi:hypothetical protein